MQSVQKETTAIFSPSLPFAPFVFYLVTPKHVLGPCYACFEHVMGIKVCNMSLGMLCGIWNIHNMEGYECKMCPSITQLFRKHEWGNGQTGGKFSSSTFVPTAFTVLGLFNIFLT